MAIKSGNITAIAVLLLGLAWLQPNHFSPWVSFHSECLAFLAFGLLFAVAFSKSTNAVSLQVSGAAIGITLLLGMVFLHAGMGIADYSGDTLIVVFYILAMIFAVFVGRLWILDGQIHQMAWGILLAGALSVLIAALQSTQPTEQFTLINPIPTWRRPGANMAQPNHLGTLLLWALVSAMYLHASKSITKKIACLLGAVLLIGIAMTESRTALLGVFAVAAWAGLRYFGGVARRRWAISFGMAVLGAVFFALWPPLITYFQEGGVSSSNASVNTQIGERFVVWPQLIAAIMERPWLGWGARGVSAAHNAVLDRYPVGAPFTYAHNVILDLTIAFGIPMTLLLTGLAIVWGARRVLHVTAVADWYAIALLIPFGLHSMLEFPFAYAYFLLPACFAIGMLDAKRVTNAAVRLPRILVTASFVAWVLLGLTVVRDYMLAEEDFRIARFEALKVGKTPGSYERPHLLLLNQLDAMNAAIRIVPIPEMTLDEIELLRKAALRFPWTAIQSRYALSLALNGRTTEADRQLKVMRAMHGEQVYAAVLEHWKMLAHEKYPQLQGLASP